MPRQIKSLSGGDREGLKEFPCVDSTKNRRNIQALFSGLRQDLPVSILKQIHHKCIILNDENPTPFNIYRARVAGYIWALAESEAANAQVR